MVNFQKESLKKKTRFSSVNVSNKIFLVFHIGTVAAANTTGNLSKKMCVTRIAKLHSSEMPKLLVMPVLVATASLQPSFTKN